MGMKIKRALAMALLVLLTAMNVSAVDGNFLIVDMYGKESYTVKVDDKEHTPSDGRIQVFLPYGEHTCTFSAPYRLPETKTVTIVPEDRTRIYAPYLNWEKGTLVLNFMPEGALVRCEGNPPAPSEKDGYFRPIWANSSESPSVPLAKEIELGHYRCLVFKDGYKTEYVEFDIKPGEVTEVSGKLIPIGGEIEFDPYLVGHYNYGLFPEFYNYTTCKVIFPDEYLYKKALAELKTQAEKGNTKALITYAWQIDDKMWALEQLLLKAKSGDAEAMLAYANLNWELGCDMQQQLRKHAADMGSANACFDVIFEIWTGDGAVVGSDVSRGTDYDEIDYDEIETDGITVIDMGGFGDGSDYQIYRDKGVELGHVGCIYWKAEDICTDRPAEAFSLYLAAAEKGVVGAAHNLAYMYYTGLGTSLNPEQGLRWAQYAADHGDAAAAEFLAGKAPLYKETIGGTDRMMVSTSEFPPFTGKPSQTGPSTTISQ